MLVGSLPGISTFQLITFSQREMQSNLGQTVNETQESEKEPWMWSDVNEFCESDPIQY